MTPATPKTDGAIMPQTSRIQALSALMFVLLTVLSGCGMLPTKKQAQAAFNPSDIDETLQWCKEQAKSGSGTGNEIRDKENEAKLTELLNTFKGQQISWQFAVVSVDLERIQLLRTTDDGIVHINCTTTPTTEVGIFTNSFYILDDKWKQFAKKLSPGDTIIITGTLEKASYSYTSLDRKHYFEFKLFNCTANQP
jgi:hypothetical protein